MHFNPRSSCEERLWPPVGTAFVIVFQSTLLMRGATRGLAPARAGAYYFNPRSSCEERRGAKKIVRNREKIFQSTLLMRGATSGTPSAAADEQNFNPRSSCEERPSRQISISPRPNFNPRSSCEERPDSWPAARTCHFNPRSSCEERHDELDRAFAKLEISIHAPHARSDVHTKKCTQKHREISIHAPHARSDKEDTTGKAIREKFQSTLLMRGATQR